VAGVAVGTAYVEIAPKLAQGFAKQLEGQIGAPAAEAGKQVESSLGGAFTKVAAVAGGAFVGAKVFGFLKDSVAAARESNRVAADTAAVIASTGGVAGVTARHVDDLANSIARKTGIDDEQIASAENLLLTFTAVRNEVGKGNDVFDQATKLAVDMAARFGGDASSAAIQLGKALQDPIRGVAALRRVGVGLTDDQERQVKAFVATGDALSAQKVILAEVAKEAGGAAAAQGNPADKLRQSIDQLEESIGNFLIPALDKMSDGLRAAFEWFTNAPGPVKVMIGVLTGVAGALVAVKVAVDALKVAQAGLNLVMEANPWVKVITVIALVGTALVELFQHSQTFREGFLGVFQAVTNGVADFLGWILGALAKLEGAIGNVAEHLSHLPGVGDTFAAIGRSARRSQADLNGWAADLHKGIDVTDAATSAAAGYAHAVGGAGGSAGAAAGSMAALADALAAGTAAAQAGTAGLDSWAQAVSSKVVAAMDPMKIAAADAAKALSFSDVKKELESGQAWEADYARLGAAAKAGLEPAAAAAQNTVATIGQLQANIDAQNKAVSDWKGNIDRLGKTFGGKFAPLAGWLATLGPDQAGLVTQALGMGPAQLSKLQDSVVQHTKLMSDQAIQEWEKNLGPMATVGIDAAAVFGKGFVGKIPELVADTGNVLHDAFVAASPVLSPEEAAKYLGIPWANPAGPAPGSQQNPWEAGSVPAGMTPIQTDPGAPPPGSQPNPWETQPAAAPAGGGTVVNVGPVNVATAANPTEIAGAVGDHLAWRIGPGAGLLGITGR